MKRAEDTLSVTLAPTRAALPVCVSFDDERSVIAFERSMRAHRALSEELRVVQAEHAGAFVVSAVSGIDAGPERTYFVDLVDQTGDGDACTCPDFLFARLGTCKHIAAVRRAAQEDPAMRRAVAMLPKEIAAERTVVVTARSDGALRLVALGGGGAELLARAGACLDAQGDVVLKPSGSNDLLRGRSEAPSLVGNERTTRAAVAAARVIAERRERRQRSLEMQSGLADGKLGVDVLAEPLFPYQRDGVAHLLHAGRALLADDMGLGKTVQTIAACEVLRRRGEAKRVLIVCPASLKVQWAGEIARYAGARAVVVGGGAEARRAAFESDAPYVILNYELTWRDLSLVKSLEADVLVLDEAQRAKNFRTKTATTLKRIPSRFLFVLTGTPVENRLDDLYGILQLVDPEVLGPLWKFNLDFHQRDERAGGKITGYKNLASLRTRIAPVVLRRRKEDVLSQLPPLTVQTRYVALSKEQAELEARYRSQALRLMSVAERRTLSRAEQTRLLGSLLKARQACNAASLCDPKSTERTPAKLEELAALVGEIAQQGTSKVLVFSEWTEMLKLAAERLDALGVGHLTLHGGVPTDRRPALVEQFKSDDAKLVLLSTDAGGVGLNLQVASYVVHLDLPWNPARIDQRIARAHRLGQTRGVSVTYLCAETGIERGIEGTLSGKRAVRSAALDLASEVDAIDAATFTAFLREARGVLGEPAPAGAEDASSDEANASEASEVDAIDATKTAKPRRVSTATEAAKPARSVKPIARAARGRASDLRATEAFALQRLRLAHVVLAAGFPGDAVRAAYEAVATSLRARLEVPVDEGHAALVAAIYRELLPSGAIPSTLPDVLARIHDLSVLGEQGLPVDPELAARAVEDARVWLDGR